MNRQMPSGTNLGFVVINVHTRYLGDSCETVFILVGRTPFDTYLCFIVIVSSSRFIDYSDIFLKPFSLVPKGVTVSGALCIILEVH